MYEHTLRETKADEHVVIYELANSQTPEGKDFWLYLAIKPTMYEAYKMLWLDENRSESTVKFTDYGEVILTGWGKEPAPEVRAYMEEKFAMNSNFELDMEQAINDLRESHKAND